jgi:hypothetical protein
MGESIFNLQTSEGAILIIYEELSKPNSQNTVSQRRSKLCTLTLHQKKYTDGNKPTKGVQHHLSLEKKI